MIDAATVGTWSVPDYTPECLMLLHALQCLRGSASIIVVAFIGMLSLLRDAVAIALVRDSAIVAAARSLPGSQLLVLRSATCCRGQAG